MEILQDLFNNLNNVPADTWKGLGVFFGGSAFIALFLQVTKYRLKINDAKKLLALMLTVLSALVATADLIVLGGGFNLGEAGTLTAQLVGAATVLHRFAVSPAYYRFTGAVSKFQLWLDKVAAYEASQKIPKVAPVAPVVSVKPEGVSELPDEVDLAQFQV